MILLVLLVGRRWVSLLRLFEMIDWGFFGGVTQDDNEISMRACLG